MTAKFTSTAKKLGVGTMTGLVASTALMGAAHAAPGPTWVQEYKHDAPGQATPVPSYLAGFQGDVDSKTGVAFANLNSDRPVEYGSLGSFWNKDGKTTLWCIQYGMPFKGVSGENNRVLKNENGAITNYIITKYQNDNTPRNHAAIAYAVHLLNDPLDAQWETDQGKTQTSADFFEGVKNSKEMGDVAKKGEAMIADAKANIGPYTANVSIKYKDGITGTLDSSFKSKAGNNITGFTQKLTLSDNAVFDVNGNGKADGDEKSTIELKTGDKIPNFVMKNDKGGKVTVKMDVTDTPGLEVRVWDGGGNSQTVMAKGAPGGTISANDQADVKPTTPESFTPKVTTKTSHEFATPGTELKDTLTVTGNKDGQKLEATSTLWRVDEKPVEADKVPESAEKVGEVKTEVTGNGDFTTPGIKIDKTGYYVWTESIPETPITGDENGGKTAAWQGKWGVASEVTHAGDVATKASDDVTVGENIHDTATVTGAVPEGATLDFVLYRISDKALTDEQVDDQAEELSKQFTDENIVWKSDTPVEVKGAGEYKSAEYKTDKDGTYSYVEVLKDKDGKVLKEGGKPVGKESVTVKPKEETPTPPPTTPTPTPSQSTPPAPQPSTPAPSQSTTPPAPQPNTPAPTQSVEKGTANTGGNVDGENNLAPAGLIGGLVTLLGLGGAVEMMRRRRKATQD